MNSISVVSPKMLTEDNSTSSSLWSVTYSPGPTPVKDLSKDERCDRSAVLLICTGRRSVCLDLYLGGHALATSILGGVIIVETSQPAQYTSIKGSCYHRLIQYHRWRTVQLRIPGGLESHVFAVILYGEEPVEDSAEGGQNERMMMMSRDLRFISEEDFG